MLKEADKEEARRRYKDRTLAGHERERYHALLLVTIGYSYREAARILMVDEETVSRWIRPYEEKGLDGLKNDPNWGGEHDPRGLNEEELKSIAKILEAEAMSGTAVGSGWTAQAVAELIRERFGVEYSDRGVRKILHQMGWSYQRGRKLYIQRSVVEQARFELETREALAAAAQRRVPVVPLAGDQTKVYLEGTIAYRWNPVGPQPWIADGSRSKQSENIYSAVHLGTGAEVCPFVIDWQDSDATICWLEMLREAHPEEFILLWLDQAPHHTGDEVGEWLEEHADPIQGVHFPAYTPEENPQEPAWKPLKKEVSQHRWYHSFADLSQAIDAYYQKGKHYVVHFLEKFGFRWEKGRIYPLPADT